MFFYPYAVNLSKMKRSEYLLFVTFESDATDLRGTFTENVKKSNINPPYSIQNSMCCISGGRTKFPY
jgi:hypothetical protein